MDLVELAEDLKARGMFLDGARKRGDKTGQRFGMLVVMYRVKRDGKLFWHCICDCGTEKDMLANRLWERGTKSCGCGIIASNKRRAKHGLCNDPTHRSWRGMIKRCYDDDRHDFHNYGGRGIIVCERWKASFENFLADMGERPTRQHSLDRINTNGNYEPDNCRWATTTEQGENRRNSYIWIVNGQRFDSSVKAAAALGVNQASIWSWCRGYRDKGRSYPPKPNCSVIPRYPEEIKEVA